GPEAVGRLPRPAATFGTRLLGVPLLRRQRRIRRDVLLAATFARHLILPNRGPEGPLTRSGDVSYEAVRKIGVHFESPFRAEPFLLRVARLGQVLDLERPQVHERQILEVEDPDVARSLEPVGH